MTLLQAAGNVACLTPTCFTENFCNDCKGISYNVFSKGFKKQQHGRGTHCYASSNAYLVHQFRNRFTLFCKTHARRHVLSYCMKAHHIPAGLHQVRKCSIRKTISVAALKASSNQDMAQQGEASKYGPSIVYKTAMVSTKGVEIEGLDNNVRLSSADTSSSEKLNSETIRSTEPTKQLAGGIEGLKNWWKVLHEVYQKDTALWGYGSSPIFTVYEGPDNKIEKVLIDEKEIQRRQGVEPCLPGLADDESKARAEQKILLAQSIAKDLQMGKINTDTNSTIFTVIKHPSKAHNQTSRKKLFSQIDYAVHKVAPILRSVLLIAIPLYGICILLGAYLLVTNQSEDDISKEEQSAANLEKMRRLKAQMNARKGTDGVEQVTLAPSEFMQKLLEIRKMARQVRSEEGLPKSAKVADTVEEYQPQEETVPNTSILMVGNPAGTEQGGIGHEDVIDTIVNESSVPTMHNMDVIRSSNDVIDVTVKSPPKAKPRIITSLDEAMAVLADKQTVMPNGVKSSLDLNGTAEGAFIERGSQAEHESGKAGNNNVTATFNGSNNLQSSATETMPSKVNQILNTSLGGQDRVGETQSIESCKAEAPQSGVYLRPDTADTGTVDSLASEGQAIEAQNFDPNFERGSDGTQDSERTASSHLIGENLENELANEVQISPSARPKEEINPAENSKNAPVRHSKGFLKKYSASKSVLNVNTDEVVGSGQPLRRREARTTSREPMSNTKRWNKELQRKYDLETDPETKELIKEIGSELDSWVTEEEVEEVSRLASKLEEGDDEDAVRKRYANLQKKIKQEKEKFGLEAVWEKYKEYQPQQEDELWWLDLRCVLCLMVVSAKEEGGGLYGLDMTIDSEGMSDQIARHILGFEDRNDASNFCRLLELRSGSRFRFAEVCPFSPKKLYEVSKEEGFKVTVLKTGQIQTNIDQTLEEVEERIVEIGRGVYCEKMERDHAIDMDSILHQRFGL